MSGLIGQLFPSAKWPLVVNFVIVIGADDSLVSVAFCGWLTLFAATPGNESDVGVNNRNPIPPVAVSDTDAGVFVALSVSESVPVNAPEVPGRKATLMVQVAPGASVAGAAGVPDVVAVAEVVGHVVAVTIQLALILIEEIVSGIDPAGLEFVTVTVSAPDVSPMSTLCHERVAGEQGYGRQHIEVHAATGHCGDYYEQKKGRSKGERARARNSYQRRPEIN